ncbi:hypothetical protein [Georgenia sp. AZ-5]|uniref:hypothetical protein n=1 Tax=Georgenia sp. AZ-5 TaxID=3367526 RepID=UPI0037549FE9
MASISATKALGAERAFVRENVGLLRVFGTALTDQGAPWSLCPKAPPTRLLPREAGLTAAGGQVVLAATALEQDRLDSLTTDNS